MRTLALFTLAASALFGQANIPFNIRFQQGQNLSVLADGGTANLPADAVGQPVSGTFTLTYRGNPGTNVTINTVDVIGSQDFSILGFGEPPFQILGGNTATATIRYTPTSANRATARLAITYRESATPNVTGSFSLNLTGVAPEFAFSYTPPGGNTQPLLSGGTISFPQTVVDSTANATLTITNRGSGNGTLTSIASTGAAFQLVGAPLPGAVVEAGRELRVGIAFTPKQVEPSTGAVAVEIPGRSVSFNLQGTGSAAQFTYELVTDNGSASIFQPDQTLTLPDTVVNERSTVVIRVRNSGTADGRIAVVAATGTGISVADVPPLPIVLAPGNRFSFTVNFAPAAAGRVAGRLRIGTDQFDLSANALGPVLSYAYIVSGVSTAVSNNGSVNFVSTPVGEGTSVQFQISNTGTAPGNVTAISITSANSVFEISSLPRLPVTLEPGQATTFNIRFSPTALGAATATLRVDSQSFTLNGTGGNPAPLPSYRFEGASGAQEALTQPAVSLTLANAYPLALSGTLTLTFNSEGFSNDPSVQFATGGRTIAFTIPANSTRALFANNSNQIRLQTGTVAGTITLTPSFATDGGINLTPTRPESLSLTVAPGAPRLLTAAISARTATSITLLITGYATSRSVTQMDIQLTPVSGESLSATTFSLNVESAFLAWYQSQASQQFGSLFTATLPLTIGGELSTNTSLTQLSDAVQSISVTISNRTGRSAAQTVNLR
ncbi:MAG: choice-of-anchor D domain-containing protein [Bryobacterales bacterium]|nr:choice-of-anchor D domain-containing protein [Bryobacterales bacterium]